MSVAPTSTLNQAIQAFALQLEQLVSAAQAIHSELREYWQKPFYTFELSSLQKSILKVLLILVLGTLGLIWYSWRIFGNVITEKFVRPSTLKEIEELKLSVAKLKLPKEHSPRI